MSPVRPIALAACMALASAISFAQQAPTDTTTQSTTTTSQTQTTPPSSTMTPPADAAAMTATQKAALKTCIADETAKNDGSTASQIKQTCTTRVAANPQG